MDLSNSYIYTYTLISLHCSVKNTFYQEPCNFNKNIYKNKNSGSQIAGVSFVYET